MKPADLRSQVEAFVRTLGSADYAAAHMELERLRQAMPGAVVTLDDEARLADAVVARAYASGKPADVKAALALREEVVQRLSDRPEPAEPSAPSSPKQRALEALHASSLANGGVPSWAQVSRDTNIHRTQLRRWWVAEGNRSPVGSGAKAPPVAPTVPDWSAIDEADFTLKELDTLWRLREDARKAGQYGATAPLTDRIERMWRALRAEIAKRAERTGRTPEQVRADLIDRAAKMSDTLLEPFVVEWRRRHGGAA